MKMMLENMENTDLYDRLEEAIGADYKPTTGGKIAELIPEVLAEALGVDHCDITPESLLQADLDLESIDSLDIIFRIERGLGVRVNREERFTLFPEGGLIPLTVLGLADFVYRKVEGLEIAQAN